MSLIVKICGLSTPETLEVALESGADMVGFVFFPASPRHIAFETARALSAGVRDRALKVALSVDADDATLEAIVAALGPGLLQLHGGESVARTRAIKARFRLPVMKVLPVATAGDLAGLSSWAGVADRILFDARPPKEATRPGGLGVPFDWRLLEQVAHDLPFLVSGGLTSANVADAIRIARPDGVDVSSGVERAPGEKDPEMIRAFIRAVRMSDQSPALQRAGG